MEKLHISFLLILLLSASDVCIYFNFTATFAFAFSFINCIKITKQNDFDHISAELITTKDRKENTKAKKPHH